MSGIKRFAEIRKVADNDDGSITVFGVASTEAVDAHGEIVSKAAMEAALPDFFKYGTGALRAMHQPIAAGVVTKAAVNEAGETEIEATVVDENEVKKVKAGVYKGFSIGGSQLPGGYDKVTKTITAMKLTEISLVDRPANPEATITMWKVEDVPTATVAPEQAAAVDALAELLNKGDVSPERLVELAQAEVAKGADTGKVILDQLADNAIAKLEPVRAGEIRKGMYSVSRLADLICSLSYLASDAKSEADWEQDGSTLPAALAAWVAQGGELLKQMTAEEVDELIASLNIPDPAPAVVVVALSEQATELRKSLDAAAASGSLGEYLSIAKAHMPETDVAKAVLDGSFEKATEAVLARLAPDSDAIAKLADATDRIAKLETERDALAEKVAKFEAQPAPSKGTLRIVVEKGTDVVETAPTAAPTVIKKADGTVDHEATAVAEIKKLHQTGGQLLRSFN